MLRVPRLHIGCAQQFEASTFTPNTCPACERPGDGAVLDLVQARIADYEKVDEETQAAVTAWTTSGWLDLGPLCGAHLDEAAQAGAPRVSFPPPSSQPCLAFAYCSRTQTVMSAIDTLQDCFMHQPDPTQPKAFHRSSGGSERRGRSSRRAEVDIAKHPKIDPPTTFPKAGAAKVRFESDADAPRPFAGDTLFHRLRLSERCCGNRLRHGVE